MQNLRWMLLLPWVIILFFGCGKPYIHLTLEGAKLLNLDTGGEALPVVVRIYQLRKKDLFENSDFMTLWKKDREILEQDLQERLEVTLFPGASEIISLTPREGSAYLAVMALFRTPQGNTWRQIVPIKPSKKNRIKIMAHQYSLQWVKIK